MSGECDETLHMKSIVLKWRRVSDANKKKAIRKDRGLRIWFEFRPGRWKMNRSSRKEANHRCVIISCPLPSSKNWTLGTLLLRNYLTELIHWHKHWHTSNDYNSWQWQKWEIITQNEGRKMITTAQRLPFRPSVQIAVEFIQIYIEMLIQS